MPRMNRQRHDYRFLIMLTTDQAMGFPGNADGNYVGAKYFSPLRHRTSPTQHWNRPPLPSQQPDIPTRGTSKTIGSIVRGFKIGVTIWLRQNTSIHDVWQRNFWEHIVRDEIELERIRQYISDNPAKWELDRNFCGKQNNIREQTSKYGHQPWMV